jgi:hypothetical protein
MPLNLGSDLFSQGTNPIMSIYGMSLFSVVIEYILGLGHNELNHTDAFNIHAYYAISQAMKMRLFDHTRS